MIEVKDLLQKFSHLILSEENKRESVRRAVSEVLHVSVQPAEVIIKNDTVYLNLKPIYKNEIFLKQEQILKKMREQLSGGNPPTKIR